MDDNVFTATPEPEMVWMRHGDGVPARFPVGSVAAWRALGWTPCDAPADIDPALVERTTPHAVKSASNRKVKEPTDG
ncbi:MAG TPA: hypothetical protein VF163_21515 [Micromonosporaceae bacterium]